MNNNFLFLGKLLVNLQKRLRLQYNAILSPDVIKESEFLLSATFSLYFFQIQEKEIVFNDILTTF